MDNEFSFLDNVTEFGFLGSLKDRIIEVFSSTYKLLYVCGVCTFVISIIIAGITLTRSRKGTIKSETKDKLLFLCCCMGMIACACEIAGFVVNIKLF